MLSKHSRKLSSDTYNTNKLMHVSRLSIGSQKMGSQETEQGSDLKEMNKKSFARSSPSTDEAMFYQLKTRRPVNPSTSPEIEIFAEEDVKETSGE